MNDPAALATLTPEELLHLPDGKHFELIDGRLAQKQGGGIVAYVAGAILGALCRYRDTHPCGWFFPSTAGYRCFPEHPNTVRRPNVSFIRLGRLPGERLPKGDSLIPPDLAVEVVSPNDLYNEVDAKVSEYLDVGVPLVWVVNPETRTACVYRPDGSARRLRETDDIDGGDALPGFRCRVADFFPPLPPEEQAVPAPAAAPEEGSP